MAQPRARVLSGDTSGTYHVLSRCTRLEYLLGGGKNEHRRVWVVGLLADLLDGFALDLHAYAIMSNHVVLRPRPDIVAVGNRIARIAFAATQGKQIIADKTGIWHEAGESVSLCPTSGWPVSSLHRSIVMERCRDAHW